MKQNWIRVVYLYLMTAIGLIVFIIGAVSIINLGLKTFIFTNADRDYYMEKPSSIYLDREVEQVETIKSCESLTSSDQEMIQNWLVDYETWKQMNENIDYNKSRREADAARAIAMILVGFPIYLFHWSRIKKDKRTEQ